MPLVKVMSMEQMPLACKGCVVEQMLLSHNRFMCGIDIHPSFTFVCGIYAPTSIFCAKDAFLGIFLKDAPFSLVFL